MNLRRSIFFFFPFAHAGLSACNREYNPTPEHVSKIFPLNEGKYRIYHVTDTSYESTSSTLFDARTYYKRELIEGTEEDLLGRTTSKLWIHTSPDSLGTPDAPLYNWSYADLWTQYTDDKYSERIEGNIRYLVLKNPAYKGSTWNGNLYNSASAQTYEYINIDTTVSVRGVTYEHCVFILQVPLRQPVSTPCGVFFLIEHAFEIYAPDIGKIVRYSKYYEEQNCVVEDISRIYYEELVSHN